MHYALIPLPDGGGVVKHIYLSLEPFKVHRVHFLIQEYDALSKIFLLKFFFLLQTLKGETTEKTRQCLFDLNPIEVD